MKTALFWIISFFVLSIIIYIKQYIKQQRLNRLLLHIFYNLLPGEKENILDHLYFQDCLDIKKDMNDMINADIDLSELEETLQKQKNKDSR